MTNPVRKGIKALDDFVYGISMRAAQKLGQLNYEECVLSENVMIFLNPYFPVLAGKEAMNKYPDYGDYIKGLESVFSNRQRDVKAILIEDNNYESPEHPFAENDKEELYLCIPDDINYFDRFSYTSIPFPLFSERRSMGYSPHFPRMPFAQHIYVMGVENGDIASLLRDIHSYKSYVGKPLISVVTDMCAFPKGQGGLVQFVREANSYGVTPQFIHSASLPILRARAA